MTMSKQCERLLRDVLKNLEPPPDITIAEWADRYRYLSSESAAEPGRWKTSRAPYQREPMNAFSDDHVKKVVLMWAAQMGKTDSMILNPLGYHAKEDPCPIMILQPTVEMAETVSKTRVVPMFRDTPALRELIRDKSRDGGNTIREKKFPGGYVTLQGANSPASLASRPIRILMADEIDRYPPSAGKEGDPLLLAEKRMTAFWNSKEAVTSTPTIKEQSRIEVEYLNSTMEVWHVPCPHCGAFQPLIWSHVKFDSNGIREGTNMDVFYECDTCGVVGTETEWKQMQAGGKYIAAHPKRRVRGFFVNGLSNPFKAWSEIAADFIKATDEARRGNKEALITFTNTVLAETWDEAGEQVDDSELMERLEDYRCEVPEPVMYLTAGVDTQDDRFEYEVVGWGIGKESWGIEKGVIYGDMKQPDVYQRLDQTLLKTWKKKDGTKMTLTAACVDSGGHHSNEVYRFCLERWNRNVWAIKGSNKGMEAPFISNPTRNNRVKVPLFTIGVDTGKCLVYDRLNVKHPGPGYCHFPKGDRGYDERYFKGLTAEKHVVTYKQGRATWVWLLKERGRRNEPLDIRNYAMAAMEIAHLPLDEEEPPRLTHSGRKQRSKGIG